MQNGRIIPPANAPATPGDYKAFAETEWTKYKKLHAEAAEQLTAKQVKALKQAWRNAAQEGADDFSPFLKHRREVQRGWAKKNGGKLVQYKGSPASGPAAVKPAPPKPTAPIKFKPAKR